MAINRFDSPAEYQPINTYSPIPFEEMMKVSEYRNKKNELAQAGLLELAGTKLGNLAETYRTPDGRIIPIAEASGANAARQTRDALDKEITSLMSSNIDYSDAANNSRVYGLTRQMSKALEPTGDIGRANLNAQKLAVMDEYIKKNPKISENPWLANAWIDEVDRWSKVGGELNINTPIGEYVDRTKEADDLIRGIDSEMSTDPQFKALGRKGVSEEKIKASFAGAFPQTNLIKSIQEEGKFRYTNDIRNKVDPETAAENLAKFVTTKYGELENYVVNKYRSDTQPVGRSGGSGGWGKMLEGLNVYDTESYDTPTFKVGDIKPLALPSDVKNEYIASVQSSILSGVYDVADDKYTEATSKKIEESKANLNVTSSQFKDDKDFVNHVNNAVKGLNNQSLSLKGIGETATKANTNGIINNLPSAKFYIPNTKNTKGEGDSVGYDDMLNALDLSGDQFREKLEAAKTSSFALDGPEPGMFVYSITDSKGKNPKYVFISSGKEFTDDTKYAHEYAVKKRTLDNTPFVAGKTEDGRQVYRRLNFYLDPKTDVINEVIEQYIPKTQNEDESYSPGNFPKEKLSEFQPVPGLTIDTVNEQTYRGLANTPIPGFNFNFYTSPKGADAPFNADPRMLLMLQMMYGSMMDNNQPQYAE